MSGMTLGWVFEHGPRPDDINRDGKPYGAHRARVFRAVMVVIAHAANITGDDAQPGIADIAEAVLYSRRQTKRLIHELEAEGWVEATERGGGRTNATVYRIRSEHRERVSSSAKGCQEKGVRNAERVSPVTAERVSRKGAISGERVSEVPERVSPGWHPFPGLVVREIPTEITTEKEITTTTAREDFAAFWDVYPRKEGKKAAEKAFGRAARGVVVERIVDGARRYRDDPNRVAQFTKHAATWLNAGCWDDEPLPSRAPTEARRRSTLTRAENDAMRERPSGIIQL